MEYELDDYNQDMPGEEISQDFLYREIRNKHPELKNVSKREYANNYNLQQELGEERLDGKTMFDDYEFEKDIYIDDEVSEENDYVEDYQNEYSYGGDEDEYYQDNSKDDDDNFTEFYGGGTHEENSLGGIPIGYGSNGKMNTVEDGETRYSFDDSDYVFSNRINTSGLFKDAKKIKKWKN